MKAAPLVSIVIRTKNEEKWLPYCIEAIRTQTYTNFEIIIVDNESTDNTLDIISHQVKL
jgi:glycosyltransferase involved in cell wall biosynthesis